MAGPSAEPDFVPSADADSVDADLLAEAVDGYNGAASRNASRGSSPALSTSELTPMAGPSAELDEVLVEELDELGEAELARALQRSREDSCREMRDYMDFGIGVDLDPIENSSIPLVLFTSRIQNSELCILSSASL